VDTSWFIRISRALQSVPSHCMAGVVRQHQRMVFDWPCASMPMERLGRALEPVPPIKRDGSRPEIIAVNGQVFSADVLKAAIPRC